MHHPAGGGGVHADQTQETEDQVIVITGASSGIGLTTAEMAAERGARVVLNARNETELSAAVERIRQRGGRASYVVGDVADDDAMERLARRRVEEFGAIDTWVNNAGIGRTTHMVMERSSYTRAAMSDVARLMPVIAVGAVVAGAVRSMRRAG